MPTSRAMNTSRRPRWWMGRATIVNAGTSSGSADVLCATRRGSGSGSARERVHVASAEARDRVGRDDTIASAGLRRIERDVGTFQQIVDPLPGLVFADTE